MRINAKSLAAGAVLAATAFLGGCASSGYPDTEERIENIDTTIKKGNLQGRGNESRDQRFEKDVSKSPSIPAAAPPPK
ncbi:MAG: hypothetical protein AAB074_19845 [Planctomycetota bacterium]